VNSENRLAEIVTALEQVGLTVLVMGGHAVRYYGLDRNTNDFDLHISLAEGEDLAARLAQSSLAANHPLTEGPSWRPGAFQRFLLGRLPDGRDEWLEFWQTNHLLPPFADLYSRREQGSYGGRTLSFLALPDLIRSKETEREMDWEDINVLEEFHDSRLLNQAKSGFLGVSDAVAQLRSRRGLESALQFGFLNDAPAVRQALERTTLSISQAILLPWAGPGAAAPTPTVPVESIVANRLKTVAPASPLHLALIEVVRRQYKATMQAADAADKQAIRAAQANPPPNSP
jgi:hypothetical protein